MKFDHLFILDVEGERRVNAADLPLRVGTGSDSGLRLPGPGGGPVLLIDILDGVPFVQPVGRDASVSLNGEPLLASQRLADGDELGYYGSRVRVHADRRLLLEVRLEDSAYVTQPPAAESAAEVPATEQIAPAAFRRALDIRAAAVEKHRSPLRGILLAGLLLLGFAGYLLFTSKSVQFVVEPADPDVLAINGGWFRLPLADRVLLREGEYSLRVEKQGYYDVTQAFVVDESPTKTVNVEMRKLPGRVTVAVSPPVAATVTIDDTHIGPAPLGPVELLPGEHSVKVSAPRFLPYSDIIELAGLGRDEVVTVQLVPRWADVSVTSQPPGAVIYAGEEKVGVTPAVIELLEGTHQLSVVRDGFKAWDGMLTVEPNVARELPLIRLEAADAKLTVNTIPRGANVTVNGRYRGQSPLTLDLLPDVDYEIGLSKAGYGATTRQVRLDSAASEAITVDLSARTGSVTVNVSPADANIFVDGVARGAGTRTLQLSSAPHRIEVRKAGYESWSRTITPRPGYPQTLTARLRSNEAIARSKVATEIETADGIKLRRVEPGTFMMGASRSEQGRRANEVLVPVSITAAFYISTQEITNRDFARFEPAHDSGAADHPSLAADGNPVANVTWSQAVQFCNFLSAREGLDPVYEEKFGEFETIRPLPDGYRLPTEAEWAWAMRYGGQPSAPKFSWGDKWPPPKDAGNYADRSAADLVATVLPNYDDGYASTAPVGSFAANALGLFDAGGNVAEWVNDYYTVPTPGITEPITDPLGPERGSTRVIRGSSWKHAGITELRLSYRDYGDAPRNDVGFRIVRNAD